MRRALSMGLCVVAPWLGIAQAADLTPPTADQMVQAVTELTGGDRDAIEAATGLIKTPSSDTDFGWLAMDYPAMAILGHALERDGRITQLDWKADSAEVLKQFEAIFRAAHLEWPDNFSQSLTGWIAQDATQPGDDVGLAYLLLKRLAEQQGHVIMNVNADSDAFHFFLAPKEAAARWASVSLGKNTFIELPDWQFVDLTARIGIEPPLHMDHPTNRARKAPAP